MFTFTVEKIGSEKPWIAKITGRDKKYGLSRDFVQGVADFTRGVYYSFELDDGVYEVKGGTSWGSANDRKFIRVAGDDYSMIGISQVLESLD